MTLILALVLAQPLNLNTQPIESRLRGGRMSTTRQWAIDCYGGTACSVDGGVLRIWTADAGAASSSGPPVDGGFVLWGGSVGSTNERTLTSSATATVNTATPGQVKLDVVTPVATASALASNPADCGANQYATTIAANGDLTCAQVTTGQLSGTISDGQLASSYSGVGACGANTWASTLSANAAPTCTQPGFSNLSGSATTGQLPTIPVTKGGTNLTTIASNQTWVGTAADTVTAKTLPSCSNGTTSKLLYNNSTQEFSCGTDQTGGAGGASPLSVVLGTP